MRAPALLAAGLLGCFTAAQAQLNPAGLWKTIDDKTGKERSMVRIVESSGSFSGRIERRLDPEAKPEDVCDKCPDERKNKPMQGLEILRGVKKAEGEAYWDGGHILDPESGKQYRVRLTPTEGGKKLEVRGFIGPFYRNQQWIRVE